MLSSKWSRNAGYLCDFSVLRNSLLEMVTRSLVQKDEVATSYGRSTQQKEGERIGVPANSDDRASGSHDACLCRVLRTVTGETCFIAHNSILR